MFERKNFCSLLVVSSALSGILMLSVMTRSVLAQEPCEVKKQYDEAKAKADKAEQALRDFQIQKKRPQTKLPGDQAQLGQQLTKAKADLDAASQTLKEAEQGVKDAQKEKTDFLANQDKGKKIADVKSKIEKKKEKINQLTTQLNQKKDVVEQIKKVTGETKQIESNVKGQMSDLMVDDIDVAKTQVGNEASRLEKILASNQKQRGMSIKDKVSAKGAATAGEESSQGNSTTLKCPEVTSLYTQINRQQRSIQYLLDSYEKEQDSNLRSAYVAKIKEIEDGLSNYDQPMIEAIRSCQGAINGSLDNLKNKRNELEKIDPNKTVRNIQEELKKLQEEKSLDQELGRLNGEQKVIETKIKEAENFLQTSQKNKNQAETEVQEIEKNVSLITTKDDFDKLKTDYENAEQLKNTELSSAIDALAQANSLLVKLSVSRSEFTTQVASWKARATSWKARAESWKKTRDAATRTQLVQEKQQLLEEKKRLKEINEGCNKRAELGKSLQTTRANLDRYKCFDGVPNAINQIDSAITKLLAMADERPNRDFVLNDRIDSMSEALAIPGFNGLMIRSASGYSSGSSFAPVPPAQRGVCLPPEDLDITLEDLEDAVAGATDDVPSDIVSGTGEVKVIQYFVFHLANASDGLYVGNEDFMKKATRCGFIGGGIDCKPTDLVRYNKLAGPFASQEEAQAELCRSITETKVHPITGLYGRWRGGRWYGLWDAGVGGCQRR